MSDKIKVAGYSKKEVYNQNIIYRNFSPDLVGVQLASDGGTPLFTMGNFAITTNTQERFVKQVNIGSFSNFISLADLDTTLGEVKSLFGQIDVSLNLDKSKLSYYAQFGSLTEFVRVSLENIIINWPASLYMTPFTTSDLGLSEIKNTFLNYTYDSILDESSFKIDTVTISNNYNINYLTNGTIIDTFNETNDLRNLTVNYLLYALLIDDKEYDVLSFTGASDNQSQYIYFKVKGNPLTGKSSTISYHIKPNSTQVEKFFSSLNDFESYLLNRQTVPNYTSTFNFTIKSDSGDLLKTTKSFTWPVVDGYNISYNSAEYSDYVTNLLEMTTNSDLTESSLMTRYLVSESITSFDTVPVILSEEQMDTTGQKVNKLLNVYGRENDNLNNYIVGISFAHSVSYDKNDNVPDAYLKDLAKVLGWDLISSVIENNILNNFVNASKSTYSGQTVGLTPQQADIELWRRLILNSPWIWKSKGARKTIEFLLRFIGTPDGLVKFNEFVYKANGPIDVNLFLKALSLNNLDTDLTAYPIDQDGYPLFLPNNMDMYFQGNGKWYRETGGNRAIVDITTGNNPHAGLYDGGNKYLNQLRQLIPNFTPVVISSETITTNVNNLFLNYNKGKITNYNGSTYVNVLYNNGSAISNCLGSFTSVIDDPKPEQTEQNCGCGVNKNDDALSICISGKTPPTPPKCVDVKTATINTDDYYVFDKFQYNQNGTQFSNTYQTVFTNKECCTNYNGAVSYTETFNQTTNDINAGYVCCRNSSSTKCGCAITCDWILYSAITISNLTGQYCDFKTLRGYGSNAVVTSDGSHCPSNWTTKIPNVTDPYTGLVGFGCKLTTQGTNEFDRMKNYFLIKSNGGEGGKTCCNYDYNVYIQFHP